MELPERILKQDAAGRIWTPREQREVILEEYERSGLPATKFAVHIGVKYPTFAAWVQKRRKARSAESASQGRVAEAPRLAGWVEATVAPRGEGAARALAVQLPGGARLEVWDAAQAVLAGHLLRALGEGGTGC